MAKYGNDSIQTNETITDFKDIGEVTFDDFDGNLPMYYISKNFSPISKE